MAQKIKIGMPRKQVESILGTPVKGNALHSYYGIKLKYEGWETPFSPYELTILYTDADTVLDIAYLDRKRWFYTATGDK